MTKETTVPPDTQSSRGPAHKGPSLGFTLSQLGLENSRQFAKIMEEFGLEPRHFALLGAVRHQEGQTQHVIGERLAIPPSTMVALVDTLEAAALLERRAHTSDRRARALFVTQRGDELLNRAHAAAGAHEARLAAGLSENDRVELLALLRRVASNLGLSNTSIPDHGAGLKPFEAFE